MGGAALDLDSLIARWRAALGAAQEALGAAGRDRDLTGSELQQWTRRLAEERASTVGLLGDFAREQHIRPGLVRLLASPFEARRLLGLPTGVQACIFNVDGVLVPSARIHAKAWKSVFDDFVYRRIDATGEAIPTFSRRVDYPTLVHGKSRDDAVRDFLASRGISLPEGRPGDGPGVETVHGLANAKSRALQERLSEERIDPYRGARLYLEVARDAHLPCAVVSGSTTTASLLESAHLDALVDACVDGTMAVGQGLARKPAPDMLVAACRALGMDPAHAAVFETGADGVDAGRSAGAALVVAVEQDGGRARLQARGADLVVTDLGEILERALA